MEHDSRLDHPIAAPTETSLQVRRWLAIVSILGLAVVTLRFEGHRWWCRCGRLFPWSGDIHSSHNSQHLIDPFSFSHVLHGILLYALLRPLSGIIGRGTRLVVVLAIEVLWEVFENSNVVIERYRQATIALGYNGDSVFNSLGDIASCGVGVYLAIRLPVRWSVVLIFVIEATMLAVYRDCLFLNILMLACPIEAIKSWQMAR